MSVGGKTAKKLPIAILITMLVIVVIVMAMVIRRGTGVDGSVVTGGAVRGGIVRRVARSTAGAPHLVVDTLNLTHWLQRDRISRIGLCDIIETIDHTSATLKARHGDRVMFVTKDRQSALNDPEVRSRYAGAAKRNRVYVYVVERYAPEGDPEPTARPHEAAGRDDFFMGILAHEYRSPVLSRDRFRDYDRLREHVDPFHVYEYTPHEERPRRHFVNPAGGAYANVLRPRRVDYGEYFR